jgi:hypothetical protein
VGPTIAFVMMLSRLLWAALAVGSETATEVCVERTKRHRASCFVGFYGVIGIPAWASCARAADRVPITTRPTPSVLDRLVRPLLCSYPARTPGSRDPQCRVCPHSYWKEG